MVDYNIIISPIMPFKALNNFRVLDPYQIAVDNNIALDSSMPDHRILAVDLTSNSLPPHKGCNSSDSSGPASKIQFKTMPEDYMLDPNIIDRIEALVIELEHNTCSNLNTCRLNKVYEEFALS